MLNMLRNICLINRIYHNILSLNKRIHNDRHKMIYRPEILTLSGDYIFMEV